MTDIDPTDDEILGKKPRRARKRNEDRNVVFYLIENGNPKKIGQFPESFIGSPLERRIPIFAQEIFGQKIYETADMKADIRKANGAFDKSFDFSISEPEKQNIIEADLEEDETDEELEFDSPSQDFRTLQLEFENRDLKKELARLSNDIQSIKSGNQNEMQTLVSALENARAEQRELMMLLLTQAQKPQQDATTQAMNILEKSLGIVTKAKAISEEIAPDNSSGGSGSILADGAKLIDSLGRNASTFLPMILGGGLPRSQPQTVRPQPQSNNDSNGNQSNGETSNLAEMFSKIKETEAENK